MTNLIEFVTSPLKQMLNYQETLNSFNNDLRIITGLTEDELYKYNDRKNKEIAVFGMKGNRESKEEATTPKREQIQKQLYRGAMRSYSTKDDGTRRPDNERKEL